MEILLFETTTVVKNLWILLSRLWLGQMSFRFFWKSGSIWAQIFLWKKVSFSLSALSVSVWRENALFSEDSDSLSDE